MPRSLNIQAALTGLVLLAAAMVSCTQPEQPVVQVKPPAPQPAQVQPAATQTAGADNVTPVNKDEGLTTGPPVQIVLIHYRGTLVPLGCCNNLLYERDEFVAVKNVSRTPQDIRGWKLTNLTRGYPTFTFPAFFPCIPLNKLQAQTGESVSSFQYRYVENPAESVTAEFKKSGGLVEKVKEKIDWSQCGAVDPLDETPMKPVAVEASTPASCILYPGQTVLVFTDEIHCEYGGFSFFYGLGNIWNNQDPDTAVLYNEKGDEVSRRSYYAGR
jgi:hypothetical protein